MSALGSARVCEGGREGGWGRNREWLTVRIDESVMFYLFIYLFIYMYATKNRQVLLQTFINLTEKCMGFLHQ